MLALHGLCQWHQVYVQCCQHTVIMHIYAHPAYHRQAMAACSVSVLLPVFLSHLQVQSREEQRAEQQRQKKLRKKARKKARQQAEQAEQKAAAAADEDSRAETSSFGIKSSNSKAGTGSPKAGKAAAAVQQQGSDGSGTQGPRDRAAGGSAQDSQGSSAAKGSQGSAATAAGNGSAVKAAGKGRAGSQAELVPTVKKLLGLQVSHGASILCVAVPCAIQDHNPNPWSSADMVTCALVVVWLAMCCMGCSVLLGRAAALADAAGLSSSA
jgi:hypothetical protein